MAETISYSLKSKGWTSFWSFIPDWMLGVDNAFYTWKAGCLYKHNSNSTRNAFYKDWSDSPTFPYIEYDSTITTVFNQDPTSNKMFKTLALDSNEAWTASITTDLATGTIDSSYFVEKEGGWYGFIRRPDDGSYDTYSLSTQGIGALTSYNAGTYVLTFGFNIGTTISSQDKIYKVNGTNTLTLVGTVASHTSTTITLTGAAATALSPSDVIVLVKNAMAESFGARGYYMEVLLTNSSATEVEIFTAASSVFKSNP